MKTTDPPIIIEQELKRPVEDIWKALTDVGQMKHWFFDNIDGFTPIVGFKTRFVVKNENRIFTHLWEITKVTPYQSITFNWKYAEYPGDAFVTFKLIEEKNRVTLRVTMEIVEDFPTNVPEFKRESCVGGWNYFIKQRLKDFLQS